MIDPVDDEEEGEDPDSHRERNEELPENVPVDDATHHPSLYDSVVTRSTSRRLVVLTLLMLGAVPAPSPAAAQIDRLETFRRSRGPRAAPGEAAVGALYTLVDEEILDNLQSGGLFASPEFVGERLEAFNAAWGGARFRVLRLGREDGPRALTVALYGLSGMDGPGSVRIFTGVGPDATLARTITHEGAPEAYPWPDTRARAAAAGAELVRRAGRRGPTSAAPGDLAPGRGGARRARGAPPRPIPTGCGRSAYHVGAGEILLRYELRYPGWKPGCDGQTEQEELLRHVAATDGIAIVRRQTYNGWHRDLARAVARFFAAVESGDRRALAELVPDPALRARLPQALVAEPACDAANAESPGTVVVAATEERAAGARAPRSPWSLWWSRDPRGWRLAAAAPVLQ